MNLILKKNEWPILKSNLIINQKNNSEPTVPSRKNSTDEESHYGSDRVCILIVLK